MSMTLKIETGPRQTLADGSSNPPRGDRTGSIVVHSTHGEYFEDAARGFVFAANTPTSVAPGTALGTAPPLALWNPPNSKIEASLLFASIGYVSGTLGAGSIVFAYCVQTTAPTGGTEIVPVSTNLGGRGTVRAFQGSTTGTNLLLLDTGWTLGAALATTATFPAPCALPVSGMIVLPPGMLLSLQGIAAAGTSPLVRFSMTYKELMAA